MHGIVWKQLAALGVALAVSPAAAQTSAEKSLDALLFRQAVAAAREYANDRTLVFYCIRQTQDVAPMVYLILHSELEDALKKMKAAGSNARQAAEIVRTVMTTVRFAKPGDSDAKLDAECTARNVEENFYLFNGSFSVPLNRRPPFKGMP